MPNRIAKEIDMNRKIIETLLQMIGFKKNSLEQLLTTIGTKTHGESYAKRYERYFSPLRNRPLTLLEIGIGGYKDPHSGGESLRAWKEYFPKGKIFGIDIVDKSAIEESRIKTFQGSQDDEPFLRHVIKEIGIPDIIIDDGSHRNDHVIKTFKILFPELKEDGGIYVVEDTHFSYVPSFENWNQFFPDKPMPHWAQYGGSLDLYDRKTMLNYFKRLSDCLGHQHFFNPGYQPNYLDLHLVGVHFYRNQVFCFKGDNSTSGNFFVDNNLPPNWLRQMGLPSIEKANLHFPKIDDPTNF